MELYDVMRTTPAVRDYLLDPGARSHGLETLIEKYLRQTSISIKELIGSGKSTKNMVNVPVEKAAEYASEDADLTLQIGDQPDWQQARQVQITVLVKHRNKLCGIVQVR